MLKRLFITLLAMFIVTPAFAECNYADKCAEPYDLSTGFTRGITRVTGATWLAESIGQSIIKKELKKATKEKFKVSLDSFSAKDLAEGRFKSLNIYGKNLNIDGTYISELNVKTLCDFNYVDLSDKKNIKFKENMVLGFNALVTADDLQKTMNTNDYLKILNNINISGYGITFLKVEGAKIYIQNNKLYFGVNVTAPFLFSKKPLAVKVATDFKVEGGRIQFTKVDIENLYTRMDLSNLVYALNAINPLNFSLNVLDDTTAKAQIETAKIVDNEFVVDGVIFIPKNVTTKK